MNLNEAKSLLISDRNEYLKKVIETVQFCMEHNNDDMASDCIIQASKSLASVNGSIMYLERAIEDDCYPRFNTLLG